MVDNDLQQWLPCPGGELDRLEVRLRLRRFWQTLGVWSAIVAASLTVGLASWQIDRKSTRLNSSHIQKSRMPSSA